MLAMTYFGQATPDDIAASQCNPNTQYWDPNTHQCLMFSTNAPATATPITATPAPAAAAAAAITPPAAAVPWYKNWKIWAGVGAVVVVGGSVFAFTRKPKTP